MVASAPAVGLVAVGALPAKPRVGMSIVAGLLVARNPSLGLSVAICGEVRLGGVGNGFDSDREAG